MSLIDLKYMRIRKGIREAFKNYPIFETKKPSVS